MYGEHGSERLPIADTAGPRFFPNVPVTATFPFSGESLVHLSRVMVRHPTAATLLCFTKKPSPRHVIAVNIFSIYCTIFRALRIVLFINLFLSFRSQSPLRCIAGLNELWGLSTRERNSPHLGDVACLLLLGEKASFLSRTPVWLLELITTVKHNTRK